MAMGRQSPSGDGRAYQLILDDLRIQPDMGLNTAPHAPTRLTATGYERHVILQWQAVPDPGLPRYVIERLLDGGAWRAIVVQRAGVSRYSDYLGKPGARAAYRMAARTLGLAISAASTVTQAN